MEELAVKEPMSKATSFINLFRSGGFLLRCLSVLYATILSKLVLVDDVPPPPVSRLVQFFRDHSTYHYMRNKRAYTGQAMKRAIKRYEGIWGDFLFWWNGNLGSMLDVITHHFLALAIVLLTKIILLPGWQHLSPN